MKKSLFIAIALAVCFLISKEAAAAPTDIFLSNDAIDEKSSIGTEVGVLTTNPNFGFTEDSISGDVNTSYGGVAMGDVDGDGYLDIYVSNLAIMTEGQNDLWINDGTGTFTANDIVGDSGYSFGVAMGDVDGDDDLDIYVSNGGFIGSVQNKLWINDGTGTFTANDIAGDEGGSADAVMGDVDGDGDLDIYVTNLVARGEAQNKLWINDGTGSFTANDIAGDMGISGSSVMGDVDGDGDLDIYVSNGGIYASTQNKLWINDGTGFFTANDIAGDMGTSIAAVMGDVDGDGDLDIYVTSLGDETQNKLWINDGTGSFAANDIAGDNQSSTRSAMGDIDDDGDLDIYVANATDEGSEIQNDLWINDGAGSFVIGNIVGDDKASSGVIMGDVDNDGDLDIYVVNIGVSEGHPSPDQNTLLVNNLNYSFTCEIPGSDDNAFTISNKSLLLAVSPNYEKKNEYNVCIRVSDGTDTFDKNFTIDIQDVNITASSIGNTIWLDTNSNGIKESNESGLENIRVKLLDHKKRVVERTDTNSKGCYKFENLTKGKYKVVVKKEDIEKYQQTYDPTGSTMNNKASVDLGRNDKNTKIDFGFNLR